MTTYTKGRKGPESRLQLDISDVMSVEDGPNSRARGSGVATMARGRLKGVDFFVQGRHYAALRDRLVRDAVIDVQVRWTGGTAVTIIGVHDAEAPALKAA